MASWCPQGSAERRPVVLISATGMLAAVRPQRARSFEAAHRARSTGHPDQCKCMELSWPRSMKVSNEVPRTLQS